MVDGRLLSNRRPGHYQNCLLKMSYLFDGRTRLGYYMLKKLIGTVSRSRWYTPIARRGPDDSGETPNSEKTRRRRVYWLSSAKTKSSEAWFIYSNRSRNISLYLSGGSFLFFTRFHASGTFAGNAAFRAITTFLRYYNFSVAHVKRGEFTDIIS